MSLSVGNVIVVHLFTIYEYYQLTRVLIAFIKN